MLPVLDSFSQIVPLSEINYSLVDEKPEKQTQLDILRFKVRMPV